MSDETTPIVVDEKPTAIEAFSRVMEDVQAIEKNDRNREQGFNFRGIDTVMNSVGPVLRKHGVVIVPTAESIETERYQSKSGTAMKCAIVRMQYTVYGPAGDSFSGRTYGEAGDSGDKAVAKAQSVAYRVFLLQGLTIPTHESDPDASSHERVAFSQDAQDARDELTAVCEELGIHPRQALREFAAANGGLDIRKATDPGPIRVLAARYRADYTAVPDEPDTAPTNDEGATDDQSA